MSNTPITSRSAGFLRKKGNIFRLAGIFAAAAILLFAMTYLLMSGRLRPSPRVEIHAENRYGETLHVVTDRDYEPFSYIDENGEYAGLDVEMINEIANRLQMNLDFELLDWPDANRRFASGEADAILNMETDIVADDPRMIATIPTAEKQYVVYGREKVSSVAELYERRVASLHRMPELGLEDEITYMDSYAAIFEALKNGEYDFAICPIQVGNVFVQKLEIRDVRPSYAVSHVYGAIVLAPENAALRDRLNAVISEMQREGRMDELDRKWISSRYHTMSVAGMVEQYPAVGVALLVVLFLLIFLVVVLLLQHRAELERETYTEQLREAMERAEASSRAKTTFLFNMSHDIRTPMNAIIGYTNLALREKDAPPAISGYLTKIEASSQHLLALINDVLEMSRIESGRMELEPAETDLVKTMGEVRDMFAAQMEGKRISFTVATDVTDRGVLCDENRLNRVLLNLLSNAYKFTPEGGSVNVALEQRGREGDTGNYELRVKDSGIGMSEEFAAKVFEAFERERTSTVSGIQGTGLGMAITKNIVDLMGGSIRVDTAPGRGTEFIVRLRFPIVEAAPAAEAPGQAGESREPEFGKMKLLLVEDNEINREIAAAILEEAGFALDTAENGQIAVDKVKASRGGEYDAVLMDVQMPVMNGYEATRAIRALDDPALAGIPIIAITANAFAEDIKAAEDAGMNGHIAKPLDVAQMMNTLAAILR